MVEDLRSLTAWLNVTETAPDSTLDRSKADADSDGTVSRPERLAYETEIRNRLNADPPSTIARLDNQTPQEQTATDAQTRGLEGPTASTDPVDVDLRFDLGYPPAKDLRLHQLRRVTDPNDKGSLNVTVPPGFWIHYLRGVDNYTVTPDKRTVRGQSDGSTILEVLFPQLRTDETPGSVEPVPETESATPPASTPGASTPGPTAAGALLAPLVAIFVHSLVESGRRGAKRL